MPGLEDLYREIILDHYRNPRNRGELATPPAHRSRGSTRCAATRSSSTSTSTTTATVTDIRIGGQGCSISQSSASMMSAAVKGKTLAEVQRPHQGVQGHDVDPRGRPRGRAERRRRHRRDRRRADVKLGDLEALRGVVKFPVRIKCATLAWNTLAQGLDEAVEQNA